MELGPVSGMAWEWTVEMMDGGRIMSGSLHGPSVLVASTGVIVQGEGTQETCREQEPVIGVETNLSRARMTQSGSRPWQEASKAQ